MNDPIYHRDGSCSPKSTSNINCQGTTTKTNKHTKLIETCYIERLIYDCLWTDITQTQQDKAHLEWLTKTKEAYETCLPNHTIQVHINYTEQENVPIQLEIIKYNHGKIKTFQIFRKREIDDTVICKMETRGRIYVKETSFLSDKPWNKV
jgi:hypothetical protein